MIRWCSYCQCFLGEVAPYDDPRFTHSICGPCVARLERDESLLTETEPAREVVRRLIDSAARGDHAACEADPLRYPRILKQPGITIRRIGTMAEQDDLAQSLETRWYSRCAR